MLYCSEPGCQALRLDVSRTDVYDDRAPDATYSVKPDNFVFNRPRLPIGSFLFFCLSYFPAGHFVFQPRGKFVAGSMRLRLFQADVVATLATDLGNITIQLFANAAFEVTLYFFY